MTGHKLGKQSPIALLYSGLACSVINMEVRLSGPLESYKYLNLLANNVPPPSSDKISDPLTDVMTLQINSKVPPPPPPISSLSQWSK